MDGFIFIIVFSALAICLCGCCKRQPYERLHDEKHNVDVYIDVKTPKQSHPPKQKPTAPLQTPSQPPPPPPPGYDPNNAKMVAAVNIVKAHLTTKRSMRWLHRARDALAHEANDMGQLQVRLVRAVGLMVADVLSNKSDPYVIVSTNGEKKKTKTIPAKLNPVWNETLTFGGRLRDFIASGLTLKVMDKVRGLHALCRPPRDAKAPPPPRGGGAPTTPANTRPGTPTTLAGVRVPERRRPQRTCPYLSPRRLTCVPSPPRPAQDFLVADDNLGEVSFSLAHLKHVNELDCAERLPKQGTVYFEVKWVTEAETQAPAPYELAKQAQEDLARQGLMVRDWLSDAADGVLKLTLEMGTGLMAADRNGFSDPYVIVKTADQTWKSETRKKTLNPVWNQTVGAALLLASCRCALPLPCRPSCHSPAHHPATPLPTILPLRCPPSYRVRHRWQTAGCPLPDGPACAVV